MLIAPVKPFFRPDPRGWCREHDGRVCVGIDRQRAPVCLQCPQTGRTALPGAGSRSTPAPSRSPPSAAAYAGSAVWISDAVSATMDDSLSRRRIALAREGSQVFAAALACASWNDSRMIASACRLIVAFSSISSAARVGAPLLIGPATQI